MSARLVVCTTCRFSADAPTDAAGLSGGRRFLDAVSAAVKGVDDLRVEEQACLWACVSHCAVYLSEAGKPAYLAGRFAPTQEAAQAVTAFARLYAASPNGAVAYRDWPEGMKGHFIARLPSDGLET
jgi:predicted metal-binding protein